MHVQLLKMASYILYGIFLFVIFIKMKLLINCVIISVTFVKRRQKGCGTVLVLRQESGTFRNLIYNIIGTKSNWNGIDLDSSGLYRLVWLLPCRGTKHWIFVYVEWLLGTQLKPTFSQTFLKCCFLSREKNKVLVTIPTTILNIW